MPQLLLFMRLANNRIAKALGKDTADPKRPPQQVYKSYREAKGSEAKRKQKRIKSR